MWQTNVTQDALRTSIDQLHRKCPVPERPRENNLTSNDSQRRLSIERESEIASNLAFLSATTDNSRKVMAVCVEEHPSGHGMTIRISSNTGDMSAVTMGVRRLAHALEKAALRQISKDNECRAVFETVIELDSKRILSRLRSRHAPASRVARKPGLLTQLDTALRDPSVKPWSEFSSENLEAARHSTQMLRLLSDQLDKEPSPPAQSASAQALLINLVRQIYEFDNSFVLDKALQTYKGNPNLKAHLPRAIGKLARYHVAASELVSAARYRDWHIFQQIHIEPYQIDVPTDTQPLHHKVHAEVQLLFFYELNPERLRPRVICASKSACYLCDRFFHIHGGFHVPRTHGRLYQKWILPDWLPVPENRIHHLGAVVEQLKAQLDARSRATLKSRKAAYEHPVESELLLAAQWPASLVPSIVPGSSARGSVSNASIRGLTSKATSLRRQLYPPIPLPHTPPMTPLAPEITQSNDILSAAAQESREELSALTMTSQSSEIGIRIGDLPYHQAITLSTPSLYLSIDKLISITFDFVRVGSGNLVIGEVSNSVLMSQCIAALPIGDIPTATELQIDKLENTNELSVLLKIKQDVFLPLRFEWTIQN